MDGFSLKTNSGGDVSLEKFIARLARHEPTYAESIVRVAPDGSATMIHSFKASLQADEQGNLPKIEDSKIMGVLQKIAKRIPKTRVRAGGVFVPKSGDAIVEAQHAVLDSTLESIEGGTPRRLEKIEFLERVRMALNKIPAWKKVGRLQASYRRIHGSKSNELDVLYSIVTSPKTHAQALAAVKRLVPQERRKSIVDVGNRILIPSSVSLTRILGLN